MRLRACFPVTQFCPHTPGTEGVHSFYYKDPFGANRIFTKTRVQDQGTGERDVLGAAARSAAANAPLRARASPGVAPSEGRDGVRRW
jgi:hypothetical protein